MKAFFHNHPYLLLTLGIVYFIGIGLLVIKIIMDTKTTSKTLAYLLLIILLPLVGIVVYFVFGVNYRKNKFYRFKIQRDEKVYQAVNKYITETHQGVLADRGDTLLLYTNIANFLFHATRSPLSANNHVEVLKNGEEKFPRVFEAVSKARHHIHLEYYIYDNDEVGNRLAVLLMEKAKSGVMVRLLYDAMGSSRIGRALLKKLKDAGVEVLPVNKIRFRLLANRNNYRDHRKIIIIDGVEVFTGGINVSDKYINDGKNKLYWRDTHLYIRGSGAFYFQFLFLTNWVLTKEKMLPAGKEYFNYLGNQYGDKIIQVAASGPNIEPAIMLSTASAIYAAKEKVYITTPYFIPVESVLNAIRQVAKAGLDVRLIVPRVGDSVIVNAAAYSYYQELLESNVRIFFYEKGFIHAKTMTIDDSLAIVGTANMDVRSQELNFEVSTLVYDRQINQRLQNLFLEDLKDCTEINLEDWKTRPKWKVFFEHLCQLLSPLL